MRNPSWRGLVLVACAALIGCGSSATGGSSTGSSATSATSTSATSTASASTGASSGTHGSGTSGAGSTGTTAVSTAGSTGSSTGTSTGGTTSGFPSGWLYTHGAQILVSDGNGGGSPWMGRGVNIDDIFLCGYDYTLWMTNPDQTLETMISGLMSDWRPTFLRLSLGMDSYPTVVSWVSDPSQYSAPMTGVINAIGQYPNVHVLVTLRSDASMIGQDTADGDAEATGIPSDSSTTPDAQQFPSGTDATYVALVDSFANAGFVLFGLTNEPGGNKRSNSQISAAMSHAVGVIRAEEDRLGVPHHLVSVQGNGWTSDISFYDSSPLPYDNVIYEVHGYPPTPDEYTYTHIPVIIGEYGSLPSGGEPAFFADLEAKQLSSLAWDFDSYSDCTPDLLQVNQSATNLQPSAWGSIVQGYLTSH